MSQNVAAHQAKELDAQGVYSSASAQDMHSGVTECIDESRNTHTSWARPCEKRRPAPPFPPSSPAAAVGEEQVRGSESKGRMERGGQDDGEGDERAGRNGHCKIGAEGRYRGSGKNEKKTMGNVEPSWGAGLRAPFQGQSRKRKEGN